MPRTRDPVERVVRWKIVLSVVTGLFLTGWAGSRYASGLATQSELNATAADIDSIDRRVLRLETDLAWIKGTLYEIAKHTGITTVPPPP